MDIDPGTLSRAQGCLLGQLAGDSLGSLVEFMSPADIRLRYPSGIRELEDGGTWGTIAGQPTDDSEMALMLARILIEQKCYAAEEARKAYVFWLYSSPFDCGSTVSTGLRGRPNHESQANGALMRVSPLGIFGCNYDLDRVREYAMADAALTHPHPVCLQANALFAMAVASAIGMGKGAQEVYELIKVWAQEMSIDPVLAKAISDASESPPPDYLHQQGWVLTAFQNSLWQLLHATSLEDGVVDTVMRGGDTDTNAAIAGALLGAAHGRDSIPSRWILPILACRSPRPSIYWPDDALDLAEALLQERRPIS